MSDNVFARMNFRRIADSVRRVAETLGQRPTEVVIRTRTYSGPVNAHNTTCLSTDDVRLDPRPKVRQVVEGQRSYFGGGGASSTSGEALATVYEIGPITQAFPGAGYTQGAVVIGGSPATSTTVVLIGDGFEGEGEEFTVTASDFSRSHRGMLQVTRTRQTVDCC